MTRGELHVIKPGLLTTVQDLGRYGHQASGVPVAGPMDAYSHRLANLLVGNAPEAATLEVTLIGPEFEIDVETALAVAGADFEVTCGGQAIGCGASFRARPGDRVRFGRRRQGARAYVAVAGGIATRPVLAVARRTWCAAWAGTKGVRWQRAIGCRWRCPRRCRRRGARPD